MACCAFLAFLIGQGLALAQTWRRRLLGLPGVAVAALPKLRKGLMVALVLELGFAAGCVVAAGFAGDASPLLAWCKP